MKKKKHAAQPAYALLGLALVGYELLVDQALRGRAVGLARAVVSELHQRALVPPALMPAVGFASVLEPTLPPGLRRELYDTLRGPWDPAEVDAVLAAPCLCRARDDEPHRQGCQHAAASPGAAELQAAIDDAISQGLDTGRIDLPGVSITWDDPAGILRPRQPWADPEHDVMGDLRDPGRAGCGRCPTCTGVTSQAALEPAGHFHGCPEPVGRPFDCPFCQDRAASMSGE